MVFITSGTSIIIPQIKFSPHRSERVKWISFRGSSALYCMRWQISTDVWLLIDALHKNRCVSLSWHMCADRMTRNNTPLVIMLQEPGVVVARIKCYSEWFVSVSRRCSLPFRWTEPPWGWPGWNYTLHCWFAVVKDVAGVWKFQTRHSLTSHHRVTQIHQ